MYRAAACTVVVVLSLTACGVEDGQVPWQRPETPVAGDPLPTVAPGAAQTLPTYLVSNPDLDGRVLGLHVEGDGFGSADPWALTVGVDGGGGESFLVLSSADVALLGAVLQTPGRYVVGDDDPIFVRACHGMADERVDESLLVVEPADADGAFHITLQAIGEHSDAQGTLTLAAWE